MGDPCAIDTGSVYFITELDPIFSLRQDTFIAFFIDL